MDYSKSFMYVISSDEKTNTDAVTYYYDINFGGFTEPYDNYLVEVISFAASSGLPANQVFYMFIAENLASNGYYCQKKLSNREAILCLVPLTVIADALIQSDGGGTQFIVKNCRVPKQVRFKFLKQDFTIPGVGDLNSAAETKWILTLKLTPIIN